MTPEESPRWEEGLALTPAVSLSSFVGQIHVHTTEGRAFGEVVAGLRQGSFPIKKP